MTDVYVSLRHESCSLIYKAWLEKDLYPRGFFVQSGYSQLREGMFPEELKNKIKRYHNFIVLLTPETFANNLDYGADWVVCEISAAIESSANIIPVMTEDFVWPDELPDRIEKIKDYTCIIIKKHSDSPSYSDLKPALQEISNRIIQNDPTPYKGNKDYIFISYSHKDKENVMPVIQELQSNGYRIWFDKGIDPGTEWDKDIAEHIMNCGYFIVFMSKNYLTSSNCKDELNYARDLDKNRFLVYLEEVTLPPEMQMRLSRIQNIHKYTYEKEEAFFEKLKTARDLDLYKDYTSL